MPNQECLYVSELLGRHDLTQGFLGVIVLAAGEVLAPLIHGLVQWRDLAAAGALGMAGFAVLHKL